MIDKISPLAWLQYLVLGSAALYFGRDLFIPIAFALLISFVLYPICSWMEKKGLGRMTAIVINVTILTIFLLAVILLLTLQFFDFLQEWPTLQSKLTQAFEELSETMATSYGISREQQMGWLAQVSDQTASNFMTVLQRTISFSAFSLVMLILIPVYAVLILYYRHMWVDVLFRLFPNEKRESIREILNLTIKAYYNFIKGMGMVYLAVGILNSIGLLILGVPHAILFGFIASILTFIPYVGIIVGSLLPITMAWATFDSIWYPVGIIGIFGFVQYLEANLIFPLAVSNRLNVNTFVMLVAIFTGGILWGVAGMILFVPFVGILKLIADHNPNLKTLSLALGTKPEKEAP
jgi:predicted PurR-regulated permease PerM